ncbi:ATP synthase F0 subunit B [Streptomyces benahoarensis]|uniref:Cell division initiation protein n=1 Tax=Streptomyces benahoarensis TaxID=2595054 RepID=A0A553Z9B3_9ACTN|nr:cell division initiation protein [Streptomyces benahoarensis]TSB25129.1 cell division initiation protein [Streptomyces benahoarensis]TSB38014.1 cell division initiation protein [Streptomyces benahoarensis]
MDVQKKLDEIVDNIGSARSVPMSASCVVNRAELLALLEEVRAALPGSLAQAQELLGGRERMVEEARVEAERIIESAHAHRGSLISDTEVARQSQDEADRILAEARREAEEIRAEADDYVDSKLANFEVVLTKTIGSVDRGREKLLGRGPGLDEQGYADAEAPERSADPATLTERADAYVDAKFGAFQAVLTKTLEAVGRGRDKLQGARAVDELGAHLAAQTDERAGGHQADAEFLAGLADVAPQQHAAPVHPAPQPLRAAAEAPQYVQPGYYPDQGYAAGQDGYAYGQQQYAQPQDPYGYGWQQQTAPQVPQQGYDQRTGYPDAPQQAPQQLPQAPTQPGALEETSLFDTSMINLDQLRQYEEGRP